MNSHESEAKKVLVTVNITEISALTCIYLLSKNNECKALSNIVHKDLDLNTQFGSDSDTALHIAVKSGLPKIVKLSKKNVFTKKSETPISSTEMQLDNEISTNAKFKVLRQ
jgi:ankyrin repeat protein